MKKSIYLSIISFLVLSCSEPSQREQDSSKVSSAALQEIQFEGSDLIISSGNVQKTFYIPGIIEYAQLADMATNIEGEELVVAYFFDAGHMNPSKLLVNVYKNPFVSIDQLEYLDPLILFEFMMYLDVEPDGGGINYEIKNIEAEESCEYGGIKIIGRSNQLITSVEKICANDQELSYNDYKLLELDINPSYDGQKLISFQYLNSKEFYSIPKAGPALQTFGNLLPQDGYYTEEEVLEDENYLLEKTENAYRSGESLFIGNVGFSNDKENTYWYQGETSTGLQVILQQTRGQYQPKLLLMDLKLNQSVALENTKSLTELENGDLIQLVDQSFPQVVMGAFKRLKLTGDYQIIKSDIEINYFRKSPYSIVLLDDNTVLLGLAVQDQGIEGPSEFVKFSLD